MGVLGGSFTVCSERWEDSHEESYRDCVRGVGSAYFVGVGLRKTLWVLLRGGN